MAFKARQIKDHGHMYMSEIKYTGLIRNLSLDFQTENTESIILLLN